MMNVSVLTPGLDVGQSNQGNSRTKLLLYYFETGYRDVLDYYET